MSPLLNMLSRFVTAFLPRSKCLLISWLQSPSEVILEPKKINSVTVSIVSPSICHDVMGPDAMILVFWMLSFKPGFSLLHLQQEALYFLFTFCHKGGIICISEVTDNSPFNLDNCASYSLAFCMMYSAYKLNKQGDNIQPWCTHSINVKKIYIYLDLTPAYWMEIFSTEMGESVLYKVSQIIFDLYFGDTAKRVVDMVAHDLWLLFHAVWYQSGCPYFFPAVDM